MTRLSLLRWRDLRLPVVVLCGALACGPPPATAAEPTPTIRGPEVPILPTDQFHWRFAFLIGNPTAGGIYCDSLRIEVEDQDPGELRLPRRRPFTITSIARAVPSVSAGDSALFRFESRAFAERGVLHVRLFSHAADGRRFESDTRVEFAPGLLWSSRASRFARVGRDTIEYVHEPEVWPAGPSPGVLLVHGEGSNARHLVPLAWDLANRGYAVTCVSLPGYGLSSGPPDFCGPRSLAAVRRVLDLLRRQPGVDSTRIALWGVSHGANVVARVAAGRRDLAALVVQSGVFDLERVHAAAAPAFRSLLESDAGPRSGWRQRRATTTAAKIRAPVLALHGELDPDAPIDQAGEFVAALRVADRSATWLRVPRAGHLLPYGATRDTCEAFLRPLLRPRPR